MLTRFSTLLVGLKVIVNSARFIVEDELQCSLIAYVTCGAQEKKFFRYAEGDLEGDSICYDAREDQVIASAALFKVECEFHDHVQLCARPIMKRTVHEHNIERARRHDHEHTTCVNRIQSECIFLKNIVED